MLKRVVAVILGLMCSVNGSNASMLPVEALEKYSPALYRLHKTYPTLHPVLVKYAQTQGFVRPIENLATVIHELLHVASAQHYGFFIDGTYFEPYLRRSAWPAMTNADVGPYLLETERHTSIYTFYATKTPSNNLSNLVDEVNAYGHVLPFVCQFESESGSKQMDSLLGFLLLTEGYLRTLRTTRPADYRALSLLGESRGAMELILQRAWRALGVCGLAEKSIPRLEALRLLRLKTDQ